MYIECDNIAKHEMPSDDDLCKWAAEPCSARVAMRIKSKGQSHNQNEELYESMDMCATYY